MAELLESDDQPLNDSAITDPSTTQHSYDRRREQVRRAQKRHREKKEDHCRELEDELHRLYRLITVDEELAHLRLENEILRDIMVRHSIPLPPGSRLQAASWAEVIFINHGGHDQHLQVKMPEYQSSADYLPAFDDITDPSLPSMQSNVSSGEPSEMSNTTNFPSGINLAQMGVDFVLSIERPCLFHTRPHGTEEPSGHALSMQGILLSGAPQNLNDESVWEVPARQLEKLFELSGCLGLDGYITPVQAWNRIISRLDLTQILDPKMEELRSAIISNVKCYGFGALIEDDVFEDLFQFFFGQ
ncbi:hypothetical protein F1880_003622 [Penicillium rolfsii]|nr:hypothetical protein F1880_003622 [Penicillium rolfsii]